MKRRSTERGSPLKAEVDVAIVDLAVLSFSTTKRCLVLPAEQIWLCASRLFQKTKGRTASML